MTLTRDTYGFAVKSTYGEINGEGREIFKDPVTDTGVKKSAKGKLAVVDGRLVDQVDDINQGELEVVFKDGVLIKETSLAEIRERLNT